MPRSRSKYLALGGILVVISLLVSVIPLHLGAPYPYVFDPVKGLWSEPVKSGYPDEVKLQGLSGKVTVVIDKNGVPHIYASHEEDLFYADGWIQARFRLFEMDLLRRITAGRLSELFGNVTLEEDKFMRNLQLYHSAVESLKLMQDMAAYDENVARALKALEAFSKGVNAYIRWAEDHGSLPVEYKFLGVKPEAWSTVDSLAVAKLIIYDLAYDDSDVGRLHLALANGLQILEDFNMIKQGFNEPIIRPGHYWDHVEDFKGMEFAYKGHHYVNPREWSPSTFERGLEEPQASSVEEAAPLDLRRTVDALLGNTRCHGASNNWVVSGSLTSNGLPMLANDPHLALTVPPIWLEIHLVSKDTGLNVYGVAFPGVPFVIIGRTLHVAWGFTDSFIDVVDWYYYKWDESGRYYYKGQWLKPEERTEVIKVKDGNGFREVTLKVKLTVHGPLFEKKFQGRKILYAMRWTGLQPSLVAVWSYTMDYSNNIWDFLRSQEYFDAAIQNAVVADDEGNILYSPTGLIPVRDNLPIIKQGDTEILNYGELPFNGSAGEGEWVGFISFPYIPRLLNPGWGYVATANNRILEYGDYPWELQSYYCDHYRHYRIVELIEKYKEDKVSLEDMEAIQKDIKSSAMEDIIPKLIALAEKGELTNLDKQVINMLKNWDYVMDKDKAEPSIAFMWSLSLHLDLWKPIAEKAGLGMDYCLLKTEFTSYALGRILSGDQHMNKYFNGNAVAMVVKALHEAEDRLGSMYNAPGKPGEWIWGEIHYYYFTHSMGSVLKWLNYPKTPASGGPFTVNVAPQRPENLNESLPPVNHGPSIRFIAILDPTHPGEGLLMLPGGNDGNPFSTHYTDLYWSWVHLVYHQIRMDKNPAGLKDVEEHVISFEP